MTYAETFAPPLSTAPAAPVAIVDDGGPVVARPAQGVSNIVIAIVVTIGAVALLLALNTHRQTIDQPLLAISGNGGFAAPPPLRLPPNDAERTVGGVGSPSISQSRGDPMAVRARYGDRAEPFGEHRYPASPPPRLGSSSAPGMLPPPYVPGQPFGGAPVAAASGSHDSALVIDVGDDGSGRRGGDRTATAAGEAGAGAQIAPSRPIRATLIADRASLVIEGTMIDATLETAIDSTRAGLIRAVVAEDVRGFDGRRVLIPRGSRLTGDYRADVQNGQNRVLATWSRLIRPDGVAVRIDSPAADRFGGSGMPGHVETNFLQRFATAVLQSALNVGVNLASRNNGSTVIIGAAGGGVNQVLPTPEARRRIKVAAGKPVSVFVARDLDFADVPGWK